MTDCSTLQEANNMLIECRIFLGSFHENFVGFETIKIVIHRVLDPLKNQYFSVIKTKRNIKITVFFSMINKSIY
jgi:hypothetical protein